jgi:translation initiation factor 2B subunit (eIF-2B alpha/beta/delta family)
MLSPLQVIEIILIGGLVAGQLVVFLNNVKRIRQLSVSYPDAGTVNVTNRSAISRENDSNNQATQSLPEQPDALKNFDYANDNTRRLIFSGVSFEAETLQSFRLKLVPSSQEDGVNYYAIRCQELLIKPSASTYNASLHDIWSRFKKGSTTNYTDGENEYSISLEEISDEVFAEWLSFVQVRLSDEPTQNYSQSLNTNNQRPTYDAIVDPPNASLTFVKIVADTNEYLLNNRGAAADFNILKDISERHADSGDEQIQAQLSTPLYLGLLGTFLGAILGLFSIIPPTTQVSDAFLRPLHSAISGKTLTLGSVRNLTVNTNYEVFKDYIASNPDDEGIVYESIVTGSPEYRKQVPNAAEFHEQLYPEAGSIANESIRKFLLGIMIAMVGSFFGLGFTLAGNNLLQQARARRDDLKNAYYTFLQKALLPKLNSDMQTGMASLKAVLNTFNQDFFGKIQQNFFSKIAEFTPLVANLTDNISLQKDFLARLQDIGITKMANATVKVFDRVDQSAQTFEKFMGYQHALNDTVRESTELAGTVTALLNRISSLEEALLTVPGYLEQHDTAMRQQVQFFKQQLQFFSQHDTLLQNASDLVRQKIDKGIDKIDGELDSQLEAFEQNAQQAYSLWQSRFERLNQDNIYDRLTEYLNPFTKQLPTAQAELVKGQKDQNKLVESALRGLQDQLVKSQQMEERLLRQVELLTTATSQKGNSNGNEQGWFKRLINK